MMNEETWETLVAQEGGARLEIIPTKRIIKEAKDNLLPDSTLTITCSPTHGIDQTITTTIELADHFNHVIPHIAARMVESEEQLEGVIEQLTAHDINNVFIIGGDQKDPLGPYKHGLDLVKDLSERKPELQIGVPAYPEGHPNVSDEELTEDLAAKAPLADYAVTQMCFDTEKVLTWMREQRDSGMDLPIYLGIPGPVRPDKLLRIAPQIGVMDSFRFLKSNLGLSGKLLRGYDPGELVKVYAPHLDDRDYGISGFHTYTFNELSKLKKMSNV